MLQKPLVLTGTNKTLLLSDTHIPYHSPQAITKTLTAGKAYKPSVVILNGDISDFFAVSRWLKDPKQRNFKREIDLTVDFIKTVRNTFKNARIVFKEGNHEARLRKHLLEHAEDLADLPELSLKTLLKLDTFGVELVEEKQLIKLGKLVVMHGGESSSICTSTPAKSLYGVAKTNAIAGHCHRQSTYLTKTILGETIQTFTTGCLCDLQPEYRVYNDWTHGFAMVEVDRMGNFEVLLKPFNCS